jgi:hypothetical protein
MKRLLAILFSLSMMISPAFAQGKNEPPQNNFYSSSDPTGANDVRPTAPF